jgi:hypothetical protein
VENYKETFENIRSMVHSVGYSSGVSSVDDATVLGTAVLDTAEMDTAGHYTAGLDTAELDKAALD